jgi:hypothetical protein
MRPALLCVCATFFALSSACRVGVEWKGHASFRAFGADLRLSKIDPGEPLRGEVSANLHYVTVALDTVFVRSLPALAGRNVLLGVEIGGIRPGGKPLHSVVGVQASAGEHGFLAFDNATVVEPFLYTGQNLTITLHFRVVAPQHLEGLRGRIAGAGDLVKRLNIANSAALEAASDLFRTTLGSFQEEATWKYQFTLYPADSVYRDKPQILLTAARHILMLLPPADTASDLRAFTPEKVRSYLRMRGNRLVWRQTGEEYTETPYIVLNITRYRRYPNREREVVRLARQIDESIDQGNLDRAKALLPELAAAIGNDTIITAQEKNLERAWSELRETRIAAARAKREGKAAEELAQIERQVGHLQYLRTHFAPILYAFERKDMDFQVGQLLLRAKSLSKDGLDIVAVDKAAARYEQATSALKTPPPPADTAIPSDLAKLPPPPARPKWKRFYNEWWFWTLVSAGAVGAGAAAYGSRAEALRQRPLIRG